MVVAWLFTSGCKWFHNYEEPFERSFWRGGNHFLTSSMEHREQSYFLPLSNLLSVSSNIIITVIPLSIMQLKPQKAEWEDILCQLTRPPDLIWEVMCFTGEKQKFYKTCRLFFCGYFIFPEVNSSKSAALLLFRKVKVLFWKPTLCFRTFKSFCTIASVHAVGCLSHISETTYRMYWRQEFCHRYNGKCYSRDLLRVK